VSQSTTVTARWVWFGMIIGIGIEVGLGVACLVLVPFRRPDQWLPAQSKGVYLAHALLGGLLGICALAILTAALDGSRFVRLGARIGLVGLILGAGGGMLSISGGWRLTGMGLMLAGALLAFFGYVIPLAENSVQKPQGRGFTSPDGED
jgi:hypothetical protein